MPRIIVVHFYCWDYVREELEHTYTCMHVCMYVRIHCFIKVNRYFISLRIHTYTPALMFCLNMLALSDSCLFICSLLFISRPKGILFVVAFGLTVIHVYVTADMPAVKTLQYIYKRQCRRVCGGYMSMLQLTVYKRNSIRGVPLSIDARKWITNIICHNEI